MKEGVQKERPLTPGPSPPTRGRGERGDSTVAREPLFMVGAAVAARHLPPGERMHRTLFRPRAFLLGGLLLALVASGRPEAAPAQIPGTSGNAVTVPIGGTVPLQLSTKKDIAQVKKSSEDFLDVKASLTDPTTVYLIGKAVGV